MTVEETVADAFHKALSFTMDGDDPHISLALTELLVDAGLVVDDEIAHRSVEARVLKAFRDVMDSEEGEWHRHPDLVADAVCRRLGLTEARAA